MAFCDYKSSIWNILQKLFNKKGIRDKNFNEKVAKKNTCFYHSNFIKVSFNVHENVKIINSRYQNLILTLQNLKAS